MKHTYQLTAEQQAQLVNYALSHLLQNGHSSPATRVLKKANGVAETEEDEAHLDESATGRAWADVVDAAERGADGLRADRYGSATAHPDNQEFMLREMEVGPMSARHGYASLAEQRW